MPNVQPLYLPPVYQDAVDSGRIILRDGSTATIRVAQPGDLPALRHFFERLSLESRVRRFFSPNLPRDELLAGMADSSDPHDQLTLLAFRIVDGEERIIATANYSALNKTTAEVAFAVDDTLQGKGLGSLLLERLAVLAAQHGIIRFWAVTHADNRAMIDVFKRSGFQPRSKWSGGDIEIDFSVEPSAASAERSEARDRVATVASLRPFFKPGVVAVVGASRDPTSIGYRLVDALVTHGYQGVVYPVNPQAQAIHSIRAYASVNHLPETPDLAMIAVPRDGVLGVVDDCAAKGVRAIVVVANQFADDGDEGKALQQQLVDKVRGYGMRLIGPGSLGLLSTDPTVSLSASFSPVLPPAGHVALASQSGAVGVGILALAAQRDLGVRDFVSLGNKADVSSNDLLQYWEEDTGVNAILLYLEGFGNPRRFARLARRVSRVKPIVAVKSGRTLGTSDGIVEALFHQTGVLRADTLEEMFDLAQALTSQPLPQGRRVGVVTNASGAALLCADACRTEGLSLPTLSTGLQNWLAADLPPMARVENPVDFSAVSPPGFYHQTIQRLLASDELDALIVIYVSVGLMSDFEVYQAIRHSMAEATARGIRKPVLICWMGGAVPALDALAGINSSGEDLSAAPLAVYHSPETAGHVLGKLTAYSEWRAQPPALIPDYEDAQTEEARSICTRALTSRGAGWLSSAETQAVLRTMRLPLGPGGLAQTGEEAADLARRVGFPVAMKWASSRTHKTEAGGVRLNLVNASSVRRAFKELHHHYASRDRHELEGVLIQPMSRQGVEVRISMTCDPSFGPVLSFGLAGIYVEALDDAAQRIAPLTDADAREMVRAIRGYRLLQGYRDLPPADLPALEETLLRVSLLAEAVPEIAQVELHPLFVQAQGKGCWIADARIRVE
ncbi:MAG: GNAT family N-acetyltransferase [Anaerolineae bacterium]|nr:GNAT family N-acetyltransferase [Anaerolineae bacterium]